LHYSGDGEEVGRCCEVELYEEVRERCDDGGEVEGSARAAFVPAEVPSRLQGLRSFMEIAVS
jgi:hypothetical protein